MSPLYLSLVVAAALVAVTAVPYPPGWSSGKSGAAITFSDQRRGRPQGTSIQFGETSATSNQVSTGDGRQRNEGQATAVSTQQQTGLGGNTQTTVNQAAIEALQQAGGGAGGQQTSTNQVNIQSNQLQQNVNGTLVNVQSGNEGVVIVNTNDPTGRVVDQQVINNRPVAPQTAESARCRYPCKRPLSGEFYCCDDGSNRRGPPAIHGGQCPPARLLCDRQTFFHKCAHDGQCADSDKCCYDECVQHHICKSADEV